MIDSQINHTFTAVFRNSSNLQNGFTYYPFQEHVDTDFESKVPCQTQNFGIPILATKLRSKFDENLNRYRPQVLKILNL